MLVFYDSGHARSGPRRPAGRHHRHHGRRRADHEWSGHHHLDRPAERREGGGRLWWRGVFEGADDRSSRKRVGQVVLTRMPANAAALVLPAELEGRYTIVAVTNGQVVARIEKEAGEERRVALAGGCRLRQLAWWHHRGVERCLARGPGPARGWRHGRTAHRPRGPGVGRRRSGSWMAQNIVYVDSEGDDLDAKSLFLQQLDPRCDGVPACTCRLDRGWGWVPGCART